MRAACPPWLGNRSFRMSAARCDSTPGTRKLSSKCPPATPCSTTIAIAAMTHRPITRNGWRALLRPRRKRNALIGVLLMCPRLRNDTTIQEPAELRLHFG